MPFPIKIDNVTKPLENQTNAISAKNVFIKCLEQCIYQGIYLIVKLTKIGTLYGDHRVFQYSLESR